MAPLSIDEILKNPRYQYLYFNSPHFHAFCQVLAREDFTADVAVRLLADASADILEITNVIVQMKTDSMFK